MHLPDPLNALRKFSRLPLTGQDFFDLCALNDITLRFTVCERGFYFFADGRHHITISSALKRGERAFVMWHEFAHFLQNFYSRKTISAFSGLTPDAPSEKLADVFARIALRPDQIRITGPMDFIDMIMRGEK